MAERASEDITLTIGLLEYNTCSNKNKRLMEMMHCEVNKGQIRQVCIVMRATSPCSRLKPDTIMRYSLQVHPLCSQGIPLSKIIIGSSISFFKANMHLTLML